MKENMVLSKDGSIYTRVSPSASKTTFGFSFMANRLNGVIIGGRSMRVSTPMKEPGKNISPHRGGNYYPARGYLPSPNPVGSGLKFALQMGLVSTGAGLDLGRVGFGFKAYLPLPYPHPISIFNLYIYIYIFLNIFTTLGLCLVESKDRYKKILIYNFSYEINL